MRFLHSNVYFQKIVTIVLNQVLDRFNIGEIFPFNVCVGGNKDHRGMEYYNFFFNNDKRNGILYLICELSRFMAYTVKSNNVLNHVVTIDLRC